MSIDFASQISSILGLVSRLQGSENGGFDLLFSVDKAFWTFDSARG
jgi:hypothetical protein